MYVKNFFETQFENRDECVCWFILPKGEIGRLSAGCVVVQPGGSFTSFGHTEWRQVYFVVEGTGTLQIDGKKKLRVKPNMVFEIPYDAVHKISADLDGPVKYIYINDDSRPVLKRRTAGGRGRTKKAARK